MSRVEFMRMPIQHCAAVVLFATLMFGVADSTHAQLTRVSGQAVSGGGKSAAADRVVVGAVVLGASGVSSAGSTRISSGSIFYGQAMTATYSGSAAQVVGATNRTLKVAVLGGVGPITGRFFDRLGGQTGYSQSTMTRVAGDTMLFELQGSRLGLRGLEYYFEVERAGAIVSIGSAAEPYRFITQLQNVSAGALPAQQYRMIGFPFDVSPSTPSAVFEDDLGSADPVEWRIGRYDAQSESYDEYPNFGNVAAGRGYWIITREGTSVDASGQSAIPDTTVTDGGNETHYGLLMVEPGWNQIATPFAFAIDWNDRIAEGGIEDVLWGYTSGFDEVTSYDPAETLAPFTGYWVFNSASVARKLLLPYVETVAGAPNRKLVPSEAADVWMNLSVSAGAVGDRYNVVGIAPGAASGRDEFDFSEPPSIDKYVSLAFVHESSSAKTELLAGDFRPPQDSVHVFDVLIRGNVTEDVQLRAEIGGAGSPGTMAVLIDRATGRQYDLRKTPEIVLDNKASTQGARYRLLVGRDGDPGFPDVSSTMPREFALSQNYPNPFNSSTTIGFDVSSASMVKITIFDVLGRTVRVLTHKSYSPGRYALAWDGSDESGHTVASGMYMYQFVAGDVRVIRKMVVLK